MTGQEIKLLAIAGWILIPITMWVAYTTAYLRGQAVGYSRGRIDERKLLIKEMEDGLDSCDIALEHLRGSASSE